MLQLDTSHYWSVNKNDILQASQNDNRCGVAETIINMIVRHHGVPESRSQLLRIEACLLHQSFGYHCVTS